MDVGKSLFIVLGSSAAQIMQVVDEREDPSMLLHEFDQCHALSSKVLLEVHIEDLGECGHDDVDLGIIENLKGGLVLELEMSLIFKQ